MSDDATQRRRIRAASSPHDPATMRFMLEEDIQPGQSALYEAGDGSTAPIAQSLFAVPAVKQVHVSGHTVQVTLTAEADWSAHKAAVAQAIREALGKGTPLGEAARTVGTTRADEELLQAVQSLLDTQANPAIAAHGGQVDAERVDDGVAYLRMSGGCQGCAASAATLRDGIETMLRSALPELRDIVDLTDHDSGTNPYYERPSRPGPVLHRPVPADVVRWDDGDLRVDPDYLAPRLGLTPQVVVAGIERGDITREVEHGKGAAGDATRITIRTPARAWAADIHPDGTMQEVPPARKREDADPLAGRVRNYLDALAPGQTPVTYGRLARALGYYMPGSVRKITRALETTMREDAEAGRHFVAALAVNRGTGMPGKGFFELAGRLGQPVEENKGAFEQYLRMRAEALDASAGSGPDAAPIGSQSAADRQSSPLSDLSKSA